MGQQLLELARRYADCAIEHLGQELTSVVLYGSVARCEARPDSDIDLLVIVRDLPKGAFRRRQLLEPVRERLLPELETLWEKGIYTDFAEVIKTEAEARRFHLLYLDIMEDGILLHDRDGFFAGVLERLRVQLAKLGAQRRRLGRIVYWDLKPDFRPGEVIRL